MDKNYLPSALPETESPEDAARRIVRNAFDALHRGERTTAYLLAQQALTLAPRLEAPWLILAALVPPQESLGYLQHVLTLNPDNQHARRGLEWAQRRLAAEPAKVNPPPCVEPQPEPAPVRPQIKPRVKRSSAKRTLSVFLGFVVLLLIGAIFIPHVSGQIIPVTGGFAEANVDETSELPLYTAPEETATATATMQATLTATPQPTASPEASSQPVNTRSVSEEMERGIYIVQAGDTLLSIASALKVNPADILIRNDLRDQSQIFAGQELVIPDVSSFMPLDSPLAGEKRIVVDISDQLLYAYQGNAEVFHFVTSTGSNNNTPLGSFTILDKNENAYSDMWDFWMPYWMGFVWFDGLEDGIHALPLSNKGEELWGDGLGKAISHGCIVLSPDDARVLYQWAEVGTAIEIRQ
ncbi:MAG: L,D-transpeptidase family protein [Anaerolineae bacterium]|nr:L,D-transpeptidase family protein [Anaerolineae bacterium]